jgi:hypothetical protein
LAFDDTNDDDRGKVFYSIIEFDVLDENDNIITYNSVQADDITWIECGRITDLSGNGLKVNSAIFINNEIWAATENDVYISSDYGIWSTWSTISSSNLDGININQISASYTTPYAYGYGYGYGYGADYFDVFGVSGYLYGYGVSEFESSYLGTYGWGYGYESIFGIYGIENIYVATDSGPFIYSGGNWQQLSNDKCYCINSSNGIIYIGTDTGLLRSTDDGVTFEGDSPLEDTFYPYGILPRRTTSILSNFNNLSEIYISQYGGVFASKNSGGKFKLISDGMKERKVKFLLQNPLNNSIIYSFTETVGFLNSAVTFLIDSSGSMEANDPNNLRLDMVKKIIKSIHSNASVTPYFQIVKFGLSESSTDNTLGYSLLRKKSTVVDFPGTEILTATGDHGGFVAADIDDTDIVDYLGSLVDSIDATSHSRTPLFDSIDILSRGINNSGASWTYNKKQYKYIVNDVSSEYFKSLNNNIMKSNINHN